MSGRVVSSETLTRTVYDGEDLITKTAVFWEDDRGNTFGNEELTVEEVTDLFNSCCVGDSPELLMLTPIAGEEVDAYPVGVYAMNGNFLGIANNQDEFLDLWNADVYNQTFGVLEPGATPETFIIHGAVPVDGVLARPFVQFPLLNFLDDAIAGFPVGFFNEDQSFITLANDLQTLIDQWPVTTGLNMGNKIFAADIGEPFAIGLFLDDPTVVVPEARVQRYWNITATGTPIIYVSGANRVRKANGTTGLASAIGVLGVADATSFGTNATSLGAGSTVSLVDATSPFYKVTLSAGVNYVFHNEDGEWAWCDVFGAFSNNGGNLPPTVRHLAIQSFGTNNTTANLSVNNFDNVDVALNNVETAEYNGTVINIAPANTRLDLMPNLKHFLIIETGAPGGTYLFSTFGLTAATHPDLLFIGIRRNNSGGRLVTFTGPDVAALPQITKGFDGLGMRFADAAAVDAFLIAMDTKLAASVPAATAKINLGQNPVRTSASDAAVTALELLGYDVIP